MDSEFPTAPDRRADAEKRAELLSVLELCKAAEHSMRKTVGYGGPARGQAREL